MKKPEPDTDLALRRVAEADAQTPPESPPPRSRASSPPRERTDDAELDLERCVLAERAEA